MTCVQVYFYPFRSGGKYLGIPSAYTVASKPVVNINRLDKRRNVRVTKYDVYSNLTFFRIYRLLDTHVLLYLCA
jgi:hypothetical protein